MTTPLPDGLQVGYTPPETPQQQGEANVQASAPPEVGESPAPTPQMPQGPDPERQALEQELNQYRQQVIAQGVRQQAGQYYQQLVANGWPEDQAAHETTRAVKEKLMEYAFNKLTTEREENAKWRLAQQFSQQSGVPVEELLTAATPQAMQYLATRRGGQYKELQNLRQEMNTLKGIANPPQQFDTNRGRSGTVGSGVNADNIDQLYNQGRVSPQTYRRFLETGEIR